MAHVGHDYNHVLDYAFYPRSIAVVGASDQPFSFGYHFLRHLLEYEFKGKIYPVNPSKDVLLGVKTYASLSAIPGEVDLVICCVPTARVIELLEQCPSKNVKIMHMFTARLGETGRPQARELEKQIQVKARELNVPIIGPNCMGIYSPASGVAFGYGFPREAGDIGVVFQSGGAATLLVQNGMLRGLKFSKTVSYGNAMDIDESDLLDYLTDDADTKAIAMYVEGMKDGGKFINSLKRATARKPVIVIKGGKGKSGTRAVSSHTAAIAGSQNLWHTAFRQCGAIEVNSIEEMIDLLSLFKYVPPISGRRVGMMGGGGGKGIISADVAEAGGLILPPLTDEIRARLKEIVPDLWDWLGNPIDFSIWGDSAFKAGEIPGMFVESPAYDLLILQCSDENPLADDWWVSIVKMETDNMIATSQLRRKPVIAVLSGAKPGFGDMSNVRWKTISELRTKLVDAGIPTFDTVAEAVGALDKFINYWDKR
jgi:acyl-CoA synthetase (NDP forming)